MKYGYFYLICLHVMMMPAADTNAVPSLFELFSFKVVAIDQIYAFSDLHKKTYHQVYKVDEILRRNKVEELERMYYKSVVEQLPPIAPEVPMFWLCHTIYHPGLNQFRRAVLKQELARRYHRFKQAQEHAQRKAACIMQLRNALNNDQEYLPLLQQYCPDEDTFNWICAGNYYALKHIMLPLDAPPGVRLYRQIKIYNHTQATDRDKWLARATLESELDILYNYAVKRLSKDPEKQKKALAWLKEWRKRDIASIGASPDNPT